MSSDFIAALIVMLIMTVFTFVILKVIAENTGKVIRDHVISQMQVYDTLLQKKEEELSAIRKEIETEQIKLTEYTKQVNPTESIQEGVIVTHDADYCRQDFASDYRNLKEKFNLDREQILKEICESNIFREDTKYQLLQRILEKLTLDIVYKMSGFQSIEQLEILAEIIEGEEKQLLLDYCKDKKEFQCYDFYRWLHVQKLLLDRQIYVRSGDKDMGSMYSTEPFHFEYDEELCEGFQVLAGNKLYDYGVRRHELI